MKVDVIIAGGQKCGTTALHHFLRQHPKMIVSKPKEIDYFNYDFNYHKGNSFYHSFFNHKPYLHKIRGYKLIEATPSYINGSLFCNTKETAERIKLYNSEIKIICLVRNPLDRAYRAYNMFKKRYEQGRDNWWFEWFENRIGIRPKAETRSRESFKDFNLFITEEYEALKKGSLIECPVMENGNYMFFLNDFIKIFKNNLLIVKNEELNSKTVQTLNLTTDFIGVNRIDWTLKDISQVFVGNYEPKINS